jgi:hypothetical protein
LICGGRNSSKTKIIICSGRDSCCKQETIDWLDLYNIEYDELYMRAENDNRADYIIKEEFWKIIQDRHNILCLFDDRDSVVHHARKCGFDVYQVNYGDF